MVASPRKSLKVLELVSRPQAFRGRRYGDADAEREFGRSDIYVERDATLLLRPVNDPCTVSLRFTPANHTVFPRFYTVSTRNRIRDVTVFPRLFHGFPRTSHDLTVSRDRLTLLEVDDFPGFADGKSPESPAIPLRSRDEVDDGSEVQYSPDMIPASVAPIKVKVPPDGIIPKPCCSE